MARDTQVLIDADVGIDDALAIIYLAARVDTGIVGIGSVHGNCAGEDATRNALYTLDICGLSNIPVAAGASEPLEGASRDAAHVHGTDGLADIGFPAPSSAPTGEHAADQIVRVGSERPGEVDLLALGPLTNLAMAIDKDHNALQRYRSVVIMGGGGPFPPPGVLLAPDMNTDYDQRAAIIAYSAPRSRMVMVGSNVCSPTVLDEPAIARINSANTPQARFASAILPRYLYAYTRRYGRQVCPMYDALAAAVLVDPSYATEFRDGPVNVVNDGRAGRAWLMERQDGGSLALDVDPAPPTRAVTAVDGDRFIDELVRAITTPLPVSR